MKLTIARKLSIAFGVVLVLLVVVSLLGVFGLSRARVAAEELAEAQVLMDALDHSLEYLLRERLEVGNVWTTGAMEHMDYAEEARGQFQEAWEVVRTYRAEENPGMLRTIEEGHKGYETLLAEAIDLYRANPNDLSAVMAKAKEADEFFYRVLGPATAQLREHELAKVQEVEASVRRLVGTMVTVAAVAGVLALVVGAGAAYIISRGITKAATHLSAAADSISRGDLDVPIEVRTGDEMQTLAESIERMRTSLKAAIEMLREQQPTA
jgi:methyl-accepting chemotaxis protein